MSIYFERGGDSSRYQHSLELSPAEQVFLSKFKFNPQKRLWVGVEEERLIMQDGRSVPKAKEVLSGLSPAFTYELSAHQIEMRTAPTSSVDECCNELMRKRKVLQNRLSAMGLSSKAMPVASEDMPLDIYPDPRYLGEVATRLSRERLSAACRVMGTHIHVGAGNIDEALKVNNALVESLSRLIHVSGEENLERLRLYSVVVQGQHMPKEYEGVAEFVNAAQIRTETGQVAYREPKDDWGLVRVSRHGTVEVRLFPATEDLLKVRTWIALVKDIATRALIQPKLYGQI